MSTLTHLLFSPCGADVGQAVLDSVAAGNALEITFHDGTRRSWRDVSQALNLLRELGWSISQPMQEI